MDSLMAICVLVLSILYFEYRKVVFNCALNEYGFYSAEEISYAHITGYTIMLGMLSSCMLETRLVFNAGVFIIALLLLYAGLFKFKPYVEKR